MISLFSTKIIYIDNCNLNLENLDLASLRFVCSDLTYCDKIYGTLFHSSKIFFTSNPEEAIMLHDLGKLWTKKEYFLEICPFCSLVTFFIPFLRVTCIQYSPLERLPSVATYSYPSQSPSPICNNPICRNNMFSLFTGMKCHPPKFGERKITLKWNI